MDATAMVSRKSFGFAEMFDAPAIVDAAGPRATQPTKNGKALHKTSPAPPGLLRVLAATVEDRGDVSLAALGEPAVRWALATGLAPALARATRHDPARTASRLWPEIAGADLTARLLGAEQREATVEILDACASLGCRLTLLKGIAIGAWHYPDPALRPMRDVDLLAAEDEVPAVEGVLAALGYVQRSDAPPHFYDTHHHSTPFLHPRRGVWVEVHRRLASPGRRPVEPALDMERVRRHLLPADFLGRPVTRLRDELQLVYVASHWARSFKVAGGVFGLLDVLMLLHGAGPALAWDDVLASLDRSPATAGHLYAALTYLEARGLAAAPAAPLEGLRRRQRAFGRTSLRLVHAMIDRFMVAGAPQGRLLSLDRARVAWRTLLLPDPPLRNLARLPWSLLPRRPSRRAAV